MDTFSRKTSLDPWFVTGLAEGEGTFTYSRSGKHLSLYFAIKMVKHDEDLLSDVRVFFGGIGKLYYVKPRLPTPNAGFTKSAVYYRVCRREELTEIVEHFDEYPLRGTKRHSFLIWKEMVALKQDFRRPKQETLEELAKMLSANSPRNQEWK
jgi:hypothetical protein